MTAHKHKNGLTLKQEAFCRAYIANGSASEAYRQAYSVKAMKQNAINVEATRQLKNPKIALYIDELRAQMARRLEVTIDKQTRKLERVYDEAMALKEFSPAVAAVTAQSKLHGLLSDKIDHTSGGKPLRDESTISLLDTAKALSFLLAKTKKEEERQSK